MEALEDTAANIMSRLEWLQMKRTCASYGPPLTPYEALELLRLESDGHELCGRHIVATEEWDALRSPAAEWSLTLH